MLDIFNYDFMRKAFLTSTLLAIILPCIGLPILLKRLSMMGDTLAHSSLAGVIIGLCFGFSPLLGAIVACIIASLSIEVIRHKLASYEELSTVIILAAAIGLAGLFAGLGSSATSFSAYLFGSIVTVSQQEFILILVISFVVMLIYALMYKHLYLSIFDYQSAILLGIKTKFIDYLFMIISAITIALAAKTIGSLIISSLLVIPVISAMQFSRSYKTTIIFSILISLFCMYSGLIISYFLDLKPGSVIVLIAVIVLLVVLFLKRR